MANHLGAATSPYLQQHAGNPVDWYEWGDDAFAEAVRRDVPILLSIGYAACHWCRVIDRTLRILVEVIKPQVRDTISHRSGSAIAAGGHGFRGFVYHSRVSLGLHHWSFSGSRLPSPTRQFRASLRYKFGSQVGPCGQLAFRSVGAGWDNQEHGRGLSDNGRGDRRPVG